MKAIEIVGAGKDATLRLGDAPDPRPGPGEVLIEVAATAVNRADLLQRSGLYPPPPGASPILGLECSGTIAELGSGVTDWSVGDRVCALLPGGGYAEKAVAHAGSLLPVPPALSLVEAGGLPEVFLTCSLNLFELALAERGAWALVHGGGSGVGTAAIQLLKRAGVSTIVTAGSDEKCRRCLELGADLALNYRELDGKFAAPVLEATGGRGVDLVLDSIGASYLAQHLEALAIGGRLVVIGLMGGARAELDLGVVLRKRITLIGSTLRARSPDEKAGIVAYFLDRFGAALERGELRPIVHAVLPLAEAQRAHDMVEASEHFGKVVLAVG
ncbi:MAG TPA: NAD(P)H-quinone oxidoreductase [Thermoanaerobaculia bacterium]|nr:NAD(P)H-quinone oxidoreductase [Thermoanaerobaculia bacterium]